MIWVHSQFTEQIVLFIETDVLADSNADAYST